MESTEVTLPTQKVMAVVRGSPAWDVIVRHIPFKPGMIIPVTEDEMVSLYEDCLVLDALNEKD